MFLREILLSLVAVALLAFPARAEGLKFFSSVITAPSTQFYFILPSDPSPTMFDPLAAAFTISDATLYAYDSQGGFYPVKDDLTFYEFGQGGGFSITRGYTGMGIRYYGAQLFGGALDAPVFSPAIFTLDNDFFPSSSTLTITPLGAVPEPATWMMLIVGFGLAGAAVRQRRRWEQTAYA